MQNNTHVFNFKWAYSFLYTHLFRIICICICKNVRLERFFIASFFRVHCGFDSSFTTLLVVLLISSLMKCLQFMSLFLLENEKKKNLSSSSYYSNSIGMFVWRALSMAPIIILFHTRCLFARFFFSLSAHFFLFILVTHFEVRTHRIQNAKRSEKSMSDEIKTKMRDWEMAEKKMAEIKM